MVRRPRVSRWRASSSALAESIKLWAVIPFLALVICLIPRYKSRVMAFVKGAAASFIMICLPFFILAPMNFISQVFTEQLLRKAPSYQGAGILNRLVVLTGFQPTTSAPTTIEALVAFIVLVLVVCAGLSTAPGARVDRLLLPPYRGDYRGCASQHDGVLLLLRLLLCAIPLGSGRDFARPPQPSPSRSNGKYSPFETSLRRLISLRLRSVGAVFVFAMVLYISSYYSAYAWAQRCVRTLALGGGDVRTHGIVRRVRPGLVWRLRESFLHQGSELSRRGRPYGMWMKWGYQLEPPTQAFANQWKSYFEDAQYVVLSSPNDTNIPWTKESSRLF